METELLHIEPLPQTSEDWMSEPQLEYVVSAANEIVPKVFMNVYPWIEEGSWEADQAITYDIHEFVKDFALRYNEVKPDMSIFTRMIDDKCYPEFLQYSLDCYDIDFSKFWYMCVWFMDYLENSSVTTIDQDINIDIKKLIDAFDPKHTGFVGITGYYKMDSDENFKLKLNNKVISSDYRVRFVIAEALRRFPVHDMDEAFKIRHGEVMNSSNFQYYMRQFIVEFISNKGLARKGIEKEIEELHKRDDIKKGHKTTPVSCDKEWIAGKMEYLLGIHGPEYYTKKKTIKHVRFNKRTIKEIGNNAIYWV